MEDTLPLPKVTPGLLRAASTMCARRLHAEFSGELGYGTDDPVNRSRIRDALLDVIRVRHATVGHATNAPVSAPEFLEPEERAVIEHAAAWYQELFGGEHPVSIELPIDEPTVLSRRQIRVGGWVDLGVIHRVEEGVHGAHELRQLVLGTRVPDDPLELESVRLAVLRLVQTGWASGESLLVSVADVLGGAVSSRSVQLPDDLAPIASWLDEQLEIVRDRASRPDAEPGRDCSQCRFVPGCPAHEVRGSMMRSRGSRLPGMLALSPTSFETWYRCRREWHSRTVLGIPVSDSSDGTTHGLRLHHLLRFVHESGSCRDDDHVENVVAAHGGDARTSDEIHRHAQRCPVDATPLGHEIEWVRACGVPPVFVATARLDAVWDHDGVLDVRDYKTGRPAESPISDDRRARFQAWVATPYAMARGLRLRLRYEYLAAEVGDDPEAWEPDADDLDAIGMELRTAVAEMHAEREWRGAADPAVCSSCSYRSICPDTAVPSEPSWPTPS